MVTLYNQPIGNYLANNTPQTKQKVLSCVRRLLGDVSFIRSGLKDAINDHIHFINAGNDLDYVQKYLSMLTISFCLYDLITDQIRSANIYVVTSDTIQQRLHALLRRYQQLRETCMQLHQTFSTHQSTETRAGRARKQGTA